MRRDYEVIVLGLGGLGSAALCWLARRLAGEVLGVEQFELGHHRGGSQDRSRIIRYSYHAPVYVKLAASAYAAWASVEEEAGVELVVRTGGLDLFPPDGAIPAADYTRSLEACGVPFALLDAAEVTRRWRPFRLPEGTVGLYQADGGWVRADRANAAHLQIARERGAALLTETAVTAVRSPGGEIEVEAGGTPYRCRRLIIAAGAWSGAILASLGVRLPLTVTQEQVTYFEPASAAQFSGRRFPIWIWMDDPSFYGFPYLENAGLKVAQDVGGEEVSADSRSFHPNAAGARRVEEFCRRVLPGALGRVNEIKTCLYTLTPDRDFVIDSVPGHESCLVAVGAGHAFKFASVIGRILSELALDGKTAADLGTFRITRPILTEDDPATSFLV